MSEPKKHKVTIIGTFDNVDDFISEIELYFFSSDDDFKSIKSKELKG